MTPITVIAFTDFADVPLVCSIDDAARVLNISVRTIRRRLSRGEYVPGVMPRHGREPWQFSKPVLRHFVEGGYANPRIVRRRSA